jgi:carbonic anhydrase
MMLSFPETASKQSQEATKSAEAPKQTETDAEKEKVSPAEFTSRFLAQYDFYDPNEVGSVDPEVSRLMANNRLWVDEMKRRNPNFFDKLGQTQKPKFLYIGCADSRVPANEILGLLPGEVFVHRNVGNLMPASDVNSLAVLEYAVKHLNIKHIIVTGHYDCGAVNAALGNQDLGLIGHWIRHIRDVHRIYSDELSAITDVNLKKRSLVEMNVIEQCLSVYKTAIVQRTRQRTLKDEGHAFPRVYGMVFDPKDGILHKLPINFKKYLDKYSHVYDLVDGS